ncbi:pirin family protein [Halomonas binhaiensis]|uniref:Pirin family protein n=1 Tax=Halomonas binhaiensis TaxID=2562282 RepID=A0A5C1NLW8_9GAMM|nr:pirin family protein [Halomonas binhaiensis]QEM83417.1 pirin family protein [Halomonas binhaiensis]
MSNPTDNAEQWCEYEQCSGEIELLIETREKDIGNFSVRRSLPTAKRKMVGPWIFFDHMGPADFPVGEGINVRPHPHVNLATVTYLFEGEILHRDSLGSVQPIRPGDINLMVAGRGITHSERERPELTRAPRRLHGLQLWLVLPEEDEEIDPAFYHYPSSVIPALEAAGVSLRVMMGTAYGVTSPVKTYAETLYVEAYLQPGQRLALPHAEELAVYTAQGEVRAGVTEIPEHSLAVCAAGAGVILEAVTECRIGIIGGEKMSRRYVDWNFVSSRKERIEQARQDWKSGAFPKVPGDEEEFIPLPE